MPNCARPCTLFMCTQLRSRQCKAEGAPQHYPLLCARALLLSHAAHVQMLPATPPPHHPRQQQHWPNSNTTHTAWKCFASPRRNPTYLLGEINSYAFGYIYIFSLFFVSTFSPLLTASRPLFIFHYFFLPLASLGWAGKNKACPEGGTQTGPGVGLALFVTSQRAVCRRAPNVHCQ